MSSLGFKSIMVDTSFCIRLMDNQDILHQNALDYFKYFLSEKITIHLSTIAVAEYSVGDDPANLPIEKVQIESFDFRDGKVAGKFHSYLIGSKNNVEGYNRRIIANDIKMLAQIDNRKIEAIITKDIASYTKFVKPLIDGNLIAIQFIDLNTPLNLALGKLF